MVEVYWLIRHSELSELTYIRRSPLTTYAPLIRLR